MTIPPWSDIMRVLIGRLAVFCVLALAAFGFVLPSILSAAESETQPTKRFSSRDRLAAVHLKATNEAVNALVAQRRQIPAIRGLNDYRAILHAHAEDSAHTGGTRPEMLAEARKAGVQVIFLSDHYRPPRDFIDESWRGIHEGVLFVPGSEIRGFLVHPQRSIMKEMELPTPEYVKAVTRDGGLIFLSHVEERTDHSMEGLTGLEIYNRHYDAKRDIASLLHLATMMTDPDGLAELKKHLEDFPDALFAFQCEYPAVYMKKWDDETQHRRLTGVAANDCHHNQVLVMKMKDENTVLIGTNVDEDSEMRPLNSFLRPRIPELTKGHQPGDVIATVDLDPYHRSFRNVSTHILAAELTEPAMRDALRQGHAYVSHDWMCDPTGFRFEIKGQDASGHPMAIMGDEVLQSAGMQLLAAFPVPCVARLIRNGKEIARESTHTFTYTVDGPGVYRIEGWLPMAGEERIWIYSNPIYIR